MYAIKHKEKERYLRNDKGEIYTFYTEKSAQEEIDWADHTGYSLSDDFETVVYKGN